MPHHSKNSIGYHSGYFPTKYFAFSQAQLNNIKNNDAFPIYLFIARDSTHFVLFSSRNNNYKKSTQPKIIYCISLERW